MCVCVHVCMCVCEVCVVIRPHHLQRPHGKEKEASHTRVQVSWWRHGAHSPGERPGLCPASEGKTSPLQSMI